MWTWMWLNLSLGALFVLAVVGIPLWLVIARPDTGPQRAPASSGRSRRMSGSRRTSSQALGPATVAGAGRAARRWPVGVS